MKARKVDESHVLWDEKMENEAGVATKLKKNISNKKNTASSLSKCPPNQQGRALAVNVKQKHLAIAFNDSKIVIKSLYDLSGYLYVLYD